MKLRTIRSKIVLSSLPAMLVLVVIITGVMVGQKKTILQESSLAQEQLGAQMLSLAEREADKIAMDVYLMCRAQQDAVEQKVVSDLNVARDVLRRMGAVSFSEERVGWEVVNQYTKMSREQSLPRMMVGERWLGQNFSPDRPSLLVDEVQDLVGGTCTVFQRMNEAGDMLRVSTNVKKLDGQRAIGTYIPAVNPDGQDNPVIKSVLSGKTFKGRAYVVNAWYITAYEPIRDSAGRVVGVLYVGVRQESVESLRKGIMDIVVGKTGYVYVLGGQGNQRGDYIISKGGSRDGENILNAKDSDGNLFIQEIIAKAQALRQGGEVDVAHQTYPWLNKGEEQPRRKIASITYFEPWDWVIAASTYEDDYQESQDQVAATMNMINSAVGTMFSRVTVTVILLLLVVSFITYLVARSISKPLEQAVVMLRDIAEGEGDLKARLEVQSSDELGELARWFNQFVAKMEELIAQIRATASQVGLATEEVAAGADGLARSSQDQAAAIEEVAATIEQMTATIKQTADHSESSLASTRSMVDMAGHSSELSHKLMVAMTEISEASIKIGNIVTTVNDVSFQTNLLALNAAVEAARAGEHGKGFAVVAEEVRNLAQRSAEAAKQIRDLVSDTVDKIEVGDGMVKESDESLNAITAKIEEVSQLIEEIAASSAEQASGVDEVNRAVSQIDSATQQNASTVEELASTSASLKVDAADLSGKVKRFKVGDLESKGRAELDLLAEDGMQEF